MATIKLTVQDLLLHLLEISGRHTGCGPPSTCGPASRCGPKSSCDPASRCEHNTCHLTHIRTSCGPGSEQNCNPCAEDQLALMALRKAMRMKVTLTTASPRKKKAAKKRGGKKR